MQQEKQEELEQQEEEKQEELEQQEEEKEEATQEQISSQTPEEQLLTEVGLHQILSGGDGEGAFQWV